jgi:hypothetical protein
VEKQKKAEQNQIITEIKGVANKRIHPFGSQAIRYLLPSIPPRGPLWCIPDGENAYRKPTERHENTHHLPQFSESVAAIEIRKRFDVHAHKRQHRERKNTAITKKPFSSSLEF